MCILVTTMTYFQNIKFTISLHDWYPEKLNFCALKLGVRSDLRYLIIFLIVENIPPYLLVLIFTGYLMCVMLYYNILLFLIVWY